MGNAMLEIHSMIQPGARHHLEEMRKDLSEEDDSGDPPTPRWPGGPEGPRAPKP